MRKFGYTYYDDNHMTLYHLGSEEAANRKFSLMHAKRLAMYKIYELTEVEFVETVKKEFVPCAAS